MTYSNIKTQRYLYKELSASDDVVITEINVKMGKTKVLSDIEREMIVGVSRAKIFSARISKTTTLLGLSRVF